MNSTTAVQLAEIGSVSATKLKPAIVISESHGKTSDGGYYWEVKTYDSSGKVSTRAMRYGMIDTYA